MKINTDKRTKTFNDSSCGFLHANNTMTVKFFRSILNAHNNPKFHTDNKYVVNYNMQRPAESIYLSVNRLYCGRRDGSSEFPRQVFLQRVSLEYHIVFLHENNR